MFRRLAVRAALSFGLWTSIGLFFSLQGYLIVSRFHNPTATFLEAIANAMPAAYVWGALCPLVVRFTRRYRWDRSTWSRAAVAHVVLGTLVATLQSILAVSLFALLWSALGHDVSWSKWVRDNLILFFHWNLLVYAAIVAITSAIDFNRESRQRERHALQLEAQLAQAQLQALKMQLHPHFLFNALNSVAELVHEDPSAAERMVLRLADLLRSTLQKGEAQEVPLEQELEFVRTYLEVEQVRFQDRLTVSWEVEPSALPALVPSLVLQPLVENAVRHGLAPRAGGGRITIRAAPDGSALRLQVCDDGRGLSAGQVDARAGLGLANTRARLERLYGGAGKLELTDGVGRGAVATVTVPFRASPAAPTEETKAAV